MSFGITKTIPAGAGIEAVDSLYDGSLDEYEFHMAGSEPRRLKTGDYVGLDIRLAIAEHLQREVGEAFRPPLLLRRLVRAGKLGRKSGEGFYLWDEGGKCLGPAM